MRDTAKIDEFLRIATKNCTVPGMSASVASEDKILYEGAFGTMDFSQNAKMRKDSIFAVYSMTKPVTSVAVMMLAEEGVLTLDDPISRFLPSFKNAEVVTKFDEDSGRYKARPAKKEITVRHLLTHTSGFAYQYFNRTVNLIMRKTGKNPIELPLVVDPGSAWMYGPSTSILGKLVEELSGKGLEEFFIEKIFDPLCMNDTFFTVPREKCSRLVKTYRKRGGDFIEVERPEGHEDKIMGDSGLYSTSRDYIRFLMMFLNRGELDGVRILSDASIGLMTSNQIGNLVARMRQDAVSDSFKYFPPGGQSDKFGLGFQITSPTQDNQYLRSPGSCSWGGIRNTFFWFDYKRKIAAVIMMQMLPFYYKACIDICHGFEKLVYKIL